jgi:hypothetical protein
MIGSIRGLIWSPMSSLPEKSGKMHESKIYKFVMVVY